MSPLPLVHDVYPRPTRPDDPVEVISTLDRGRLTMTRVDYGVRGLDRHCLVTLPSKRWTPTAEPGPVWLRFTVRYSDPERADERVPFLAMVNWYERGEPEREERLRFFAGMEETTISLPLQPEEYSDRYQVTVYADRSYRGRLTIGDPHVVADRTVHWFGPGDDQVGPVDRRKQWRQEGRRVVCSSFFGEHYAEMPEGWDLGKVHPTALAAAEWFLYDKVEAAFLGTRPSRMPDAPAGPRPEGRETLLSFSMGTDSTAAAALLPEETKSFYCRRDYSSYLLPNGSRADLPAYALYEEGLSRVPSLDIIPNTFEQIRTAAGQRHGYGHGYGYAAVGVLLADHVDAGALAFGSVMEQVFLRSGNIYSDVVAQQSSMYNGVAAVLRLAGLHMTMPTGGCSEVLTSKIANEGRYHGIAISCPRPDEHGRPCGTCFKCFRKERIDGVTDVPDPDPAVVAALEKYPLKSATSVIYACQKGGYSQPSLERYLDADMSFLDRYYDYAVENMVHPRLRGHVREQLAALGIQPMTEQDEASLRSVTEIFWPEQVKR